MSLLDQLHKILEDSSGVYPELVLISGAILILVVGLFSKNKLLLSAIFIAVLLGSSFGLRSDWDLILFDQFENNELVYFAKLMFIITGIAIVFFRHFVDRLSEYYFLILSLLAGSFLMASSHHFLLLYIAVELTSFSSYFLTGFTFKKKAIEGTFKYYLYGAVSSAVMLYGISLYYGDTGELVFTQVESSLGEIGLLLVLVGLLFKSSVAPFHIWAPSAYQVAPTPVVAVFSIVPKVAGLVVIAHLVNYALTDWLIEILIFIATLSVVWGTFAAVKQVNVKRLLAFGAIAHSGFLLPLVLVNSELFLSSFKYYVLVYAAMNLGIFYIVSLFETGDGEVQIDSFSGQGKLYPLVGVYAVILLISLVGLPPTGGFNAKLLLFSSALNQFNETGLQAWIIFFSVGIVSSVIALFYYLRIPYFYFMKDGDTGSTRITPVQVVFATIFVVVVLIIFIDPNILDIFV